MRRALRACTGVQVSFGSGSVSGQVCCARGGPAAAGKQRDARLFRGLWVGWALAPHAIGGEIEEEVAAAGRRRGTFAGKGMGARRPTRRRLRLKCVKACFLLARRGAKHLLPVSARQPSSWECFNVGSAP